MKRWYPAVVVLLVLISCASNPEISGMQQRSHGNFIIHYCDERDAVLEDLGRTLDAAEKAGAALFNTTFSVTHVFIYSDHIIGDKVLHCPLWLNEGVDLYLTNGRRGEALYQFMEFPPEKIFTSSNPLLALMKQGDYNVALGVPISKIYQDWKNWLQGHMNG